MTKILKYCVYCGKKLKYEHEDDEESVSCYCSGGRHSFEWNEVKPDG